MFIKLTRILENFSEKGQKRLQDLQKKAEDIANNNVQKRDEYGRTAEWYREQNLNVPEDLLEQEEEIEASIELMEDDFELEEAEYMCNLKYVEDFDTLQEGTLIGYKSGREVVVKETIEEIFKLINTGNE